MTLYKEPTAEAEPTHSVPLTYDQRLRSRLFLQLTAKESAHIILPRGVRLSSGLHIRSTSGSVLRIDSAGEDVSAVEATGLALARACYHLGNRHIPAAITETSVCYQRDAVIDDMMKGLGFAIVHRNVPFEPEVGAYHRH